MNSTAPSLRQTATPQDTILSARGITKTYRKGSEELRVLRGADISVGAGEMLAVVGRSGSGKSTLLHILATLDRPDSGEVAYQGKPLNGLLRRRRNNYRNRSIGMIFQAYHLLPEMTVLENVLMPAMIRYSVYGYFFRRTAIRERAKSLLERVGLGHRLTHKPRELSGGEMQRTAIARALMNEPRLLLADEPTGNLDPASGEGVLDLLSDLNQTEGLTVVMVTHDRAIAARADRTVTLVEGRVADESAELRVQG